MHILSFLAGGLVLLITLLFCTLIAFIWGLKQLLTIGQQNEAMLILLNQISVNIWQVARMQTEAEQDKKDAVPALERKLTLHRQSEAF